MAKLDEQYSGWLSLPQTQHLMQLLNEGAGDKRAITRCVGGCVRDTLMQLATVDTEVDMATELEPQAVMARLQAANVKVVPTGIKHGTVSAILYRGDTPLVYEITTLRDDVETDGRHAEVAFTEDWQGDAARRDFTINALYADADGTLHDPTGQGLADIEARRVRFIGDAAARIEEDYLRVLRYFRFHFRLTADTPVDNVALAACRGAAVPLRGLSGERKQQEMLKIMALPEAARAARALHKADLLRPVLGIEPMGFAALEAMLKLSDDPLLRLMSLLPTAEAVQTLSDALRLSRKQMMRLVKALEMPLDLTHLSAALYFDGAEAVRDRALLALAHMPSDGSGDAGDTIKALHAAIAESANYTRPKFPLTGAMMQKAGLKDGPEMGVMARTLEQWWVAEGFPDEKTVKAELQKRLA
ncbi:MAG: CCA tRNA nucleotidyltransferase [PS1 clade bacterium]|uniref:CCA tRNA nucleotidyltransferase n=1 Tax=PS1 clade bacterium TaxID=2175152 RepID=A0A937HJ83_9PROT|nr:CCA tRNA nucleotidyltransferase [PS1 clade bacterium]